MSYIFIGAWTEHDSSGSHWHLTVEDGTAFGVMTLLTLFIAAAVKSSWSCISEMSWMKAPNFNEDKKFGYSSTVWEFLKVIFKDQWSQISLKKCWIGVIAVVHLFAAVGVPVGASLGLTYGTQEIPTVKSVGKKCSIPNPSANNRSAVTVRNANLSLAATEYFQNCHEKSLVSCQSNFVSTDLPYLKSQSVCPFSEEICSNSNTTGSNSTLRFETPWLAPYQLGINTKSKLHFRKAITCSVLQHSEFRLETSNNTSENQNLKPAMVLRFGAAPVYEYDVFNLSLIAGGYRLHTIPQNAADPPQLDQRLTQANGFVTVVLLQAPDVYYTRQIEDEMFSAYNTSTFVSSGLRWSTNELVKVAACVDQYQMLNNETGVQTEWDSPEKAYGSWSRVEQSREDRLTWFIIGYALQLSSLHYTIWGRGVSALAAQRSLFGLNQERINANQWETEVGRWFGISLVKMQISILAIVARSASLPEDDFVNALANSSYANYTDICNMITVKAGEYTNIHLSGFVATVVVGFLILIVSQWFLEPVDSRTPGTQPGGGSSNPTTPTTQPGRGSANSRTSTIPPETGIPLNNLPPRQETLTPAAEPENIPSQQSSQAQEPVGADPPVNSHSSNQGIVSLNYPNHDLVQPNTSVAVASSAPSAPSASSASSASTASRPLLQETVTPPNPPDTVDSPSPAAQQQPTINRDATHE